MIFKNEYHEDWKRRFAWFPVSIIVDIDGSFDFVTVWLDWYEVKWYRGQSGWTERHRLIK